MLMGSIIMLSGIRQITHAKTDGAPSGNTGSPGDEQTCAHVECHTGTAVERVGMISTNVPASGYLRDSIYTITVQVIDSGVVKFGFQASPQNEEGDKMGVMFIVDGDRTKLTGGGKYITHKEEGTTATDTATWTFEWQPGSSSGDVTFYMAANASNNEENATGDHIYYDKIMVTEDSTNIPLQVSSPLAVEQILYTQGAWVISCYSLEEIDIQVISMNGQEVKRVQSQDGMQPIRIEHDDLPKGNYILHIRSASGVAARQVAVW